LAAWQVVGASLAPLASAGFYLAAMMNLSATSRFSSILVLALLGLNTGCSSTSHAAPEPRGNGPVLNAAASSQQSLADVVERVLPSVVSIRSTRVAQQAGGPMGLFFGAPPESRKQEGLGSGVVLSADGFIITNNHVIEGADEVLVRTNDDREWSAKIVGADAKSDIALLKLEGDVQGLTPVKVGDSGALRLGETVLAVGNPFGVGQTVTMGIVSAKDRADMGIVDYEDFIQTDAAINPGNSGGALINTRGELVGINTAILSRSGGNMGIGFAIPTNMAVPILEALKTEGKVTRGYLGAELQEVTPDLREAMGLGQASGVLIANVVPDGPAKKAGILSGDLVTHVGGKPVHSMGQLRNLVAGHGSGKPLELSVIRGGRSLRIQAVLGTLPSADTPREVKTPEKSSAPDVDGVMLADLTAEARQELGLPAQVEGVVVVRVLPGSKAARASLRRGDVIVEVNRKPVKSAREAQEVYRAAGGAKLLLVLRGNQHRYVVMK
jgi:serine protease Do